MKGDIPKALAVAQGALFVEPARVDVRNDLARLMVQGGEYAAAGAVLASVEAEGDLGLIPASLVLKAVGRALGKEGDIGEEERAAGLRETQRAIMLSPSDMNGWQALAYIRSKSGTGS